MSSITLDNITMAVDNVDEMVVFYDSVFEAGLELHMPFAGTRFFRGEIAGIELILVPNDIAQVKAEQSRIQLQFRVDDAEQIIDLAIASGGTPLDEAEERDGEINGAVFDPDGNSLVFVQRMMD